MSHSATDDVVHLRSAWLEVGLISYGGRIAYVRAIDSAGEMADVAVGFDEAQQWRDDPTYQGAMIGRVANRIAGGTFELDGVTHTVPANEGSTALHGGPGGFSQRDWTVGAVQRDDDGESVELRLRSADGDMGFPGTLDVRVTVTVAGSDLILDHTATTDAPTPVNLTNHAYFNLSGRGQVDDHRIEIAASRFLHVDADVLPTGEIGSVDGTPLDLRTPATIGDRWREPHPQMRLGRGFDHTFVIDDDAPTGTATDGRSVRRVAHVSDPASGRTLTVLTDQPSVQFYSGGMLDGTVAGRSGLLRQGDALCLETQGFPDAVHHSNFPSIILSPGETYRHLTIYRFGAA